MADRLLPTFSLLKDEESDDVNVLLQNLGKKEAFRDTGVDNIDVEKQLDSEPEKEKLLANPLTEDDDDTGDEPGWIPAKPRRRKGRPFTGKSKVDSTESTDQEGEHGSGKAEENNTSLSSSEIGEEEQPAEENGGEDAVEEETPKSGGKRRGKRRNKSKSNNVVENEGVFGRVGRLAAAGVFFLVFALLFTANPSSELFPVDFVD